MVWKESRDGGREVLVVELGAVAVGKGECQESAGTLEGGEGCG